MQGLNAIIDISHFNTVSSFATVKAAGIQGVVHKATQGTGYTDPTYATQKPQALAAGLRWGAYHFGTGGDGAAQAKYFLNVVGGGQPIPPSTLLALDFESNPSGTSMTVQQARDFVTFVHQQTGRWPGFYSGATIREALGDTKDPVLGNCWLWVAQYADAPQVQASWQSWTLWQYTDGVNGPQPHTVNGVSQCDRDTFNGDQAAFNAFWPA